MEGVPGAEQVRGVGVEAFLDDRLHRALLDGGQGREHREPLAVERHPDRCGRSGGSRQGNRDGRRGSRLLTRGAGLRGGDGTGHDGTAPPATALAVRLPADQARGRRLLARRRRFALGGCFVGGSITGGSVASGSFPGAKVIGGNFLPFFAAGTAGAAANTESDSEGVLTTPRIASRNAWSAFRANPRGLRLPCS